LGHGSKLCHISIQWIIQTQRRGVRLTPCTPVHERPKAIQPWRYNHHQSMRQFHKQQDTLSQIQFSWLLRRIEQSGTRVPSGVPPKSLPSAHSLHLQNMFHLTLILSKDHFPLQQEMFRLSKRDVTYCWLREAQNFLVSGVILMHFTFELYLQSWPHLLRPNSNAMTSHRLAQDTPPCTKYSILRLDA
jgi:hypothetical protein